MKYSERQRAIFDTYENTRKNIVIEAGPGSGKTFCLVECCKRTPSYKRVLFMSFNKSIADELKEKLPPQCTIGTFHSMGLRILYKNFSFKMKLDENKTFKIGFKNLKFDDHFPQKQKMRYLMELQEIWNQVRINLLVDYENDIPNICLDKDFEFRDRMVEDIETIEQVYLRQLKRINKGEDFSIDFTDMLYIPYLLVSEDNFPKFDVVMVDECQDQNCLQRETILRFINPKGGRFIFVGDKKQCIYSFTGSSINNFETIQRTKNTVTLPLDITYRCAKKIVEEADKVFPGLIAYENAEEGEVCTGSYMTAQDGDFILCRNNAPLMEAFINLLSEGKKVTIKGKEFGNSLCAILDKIDKIDDLNYLLEKKKKELKQRGLSDYAIQNNPSFLNLQEKCSILSRLFSIWNNIQMMKEVIETVYTDKTEGIVLSTIHKSKGLETDVVYFLQPELIPSPHITTEEMLYSEKCLKFVAITRAKKRLVYCH